MEPTKEQLEKLKKLELQMLKEVVVICNRLNLRYYLLGGTLLGAVRHKGFIPWDDDIDIGMPREDYEIFLNEAQGFLPENYFVQTNKSDMEYPMNFCKIRKCDTTFIESSVKNCNINHGVFIDIFPLDYYPDGFLKKKIFYLKNRVLYGRIVEIFNVAHHNTSHYAFKRRLAKLFTFYMSPQMAVMKREKLLKSVKDGKKIANYCGAWGEREIVPKEWYGEGVELEFEGLKVIGPKEYDKWLTQVYGDYTKLPPEEKRVGHHYTEVIDLNTSYKKYIDHKEGQ